MRLTRHSHKWGCDLALQTDTASSYGLPVLLIDGTPHGCEDKYVPSVGVCSATASMVLLDALHETPLTRDEYEACEPAIRVYLAPGRHSCSSV